MAGRGRGRGQLTFNAELLGIGRGDAPQVIEVYAMYSHRQPDQDNLVKVIFANSLRTSVRSLAAAQVPAAASTDSAIGRGRRTGLPSCREVDAVFTFFHCTLTSIKYDALLTLILFRQERAANPDEGLAVLHNSPAIRLCREEQIHGGEVL